MLKISTTRTLVALVSLLVFHRILVASGVQISIPMKCRTEGRLSFTVPENEQNDPTTSTYHLAFTESIDSVDDRSVVSIGYVAYEPNKYYMRDGMPAVTVGPDGICTAAQRAQFVPEIAWLLERLIPGDQGVVPTFPHLVGPTGLLNAVQKILNSSKEKYKFDGAVTHRNIPCDIYTKSVLLRESGLTLKVELFSPSSGVKFRNLETTYFSVRTTIIDPKVVQDEENRRKSFTIDFYNIESFDGDGNTEKSDAMINDFSLPFGRGCSEYLAQLQPEIKSNSFSMKYSQASGSNFILMAYDHLSGYLRKEVIGGSVSIWDLEEDLLYHIDNEAPASFEATTAYKGNTQTCSVMSVVDEKLGPDMRPYEVNGESLNVLKMIGASFVAYLGHGTVRDLPCLVYEIIVDRPPVVFGLKNDDLSLNLETTTEPKPIKDYIVQFYVLEGERIYMHGTTPFPINFWPARITLYRRYKSLGLIDFVDQLDILDFYWSLDGWDKKGSELFMASECFDDEDEQFRIELSLSFFRSPQNQAKHSDALILAYNKFRLEYELINDIFKLYHISRMHLVEYELKLRPNHVNLNMVVGDRKEYKKLVYFGQGQLPQANSYQTNRIDFYSLNEETCILTSSHIADISLVVFCPFDPATGSDQVCTAVYDENEPTITNNNDSNKPVCHVYKFEPTTIPYEKRAVETVYYKREYLYRHQLSIVADIPSNKGEQQQDQEVLEGSIINYDVTYDVKLITVENYSYTLDEDQDNIETQERPAEAKVTTPNDGENRRVRSIDSFDYQSEGDCARMCNLDVACRSYSYCSNSKASPNEGKKNTCILSSLDIRTSKLTRQLTELIGLSTNKQTLVRDNDKTIYKLQFALECNIYERDYLNMFRRTDEVIRLDYDAARQIQTAPTTFDCAKQSVDLEHASKESNHHIAMFAYCANTNSWEGACLLDENLFAVTSKQDSGNTTNNKETDKDKELLCRVYRKKYQTYFKISGHVLKQEPKQQVELWLNTVEECARACWIRLGQVCASFDYCSPGTCLVNTVSSSSSGVALESRPNCLHYDRDMSLDELRKQHLIGPHEIYQGDSGSASSLTFWQVMLSILTYALVAGAFLYGLVLGNQVNDKLFASDQPIGRRLTLAGASAVASAQQLFGFSGFSNHDNDSDEHISSSYPNEARAIQMDVIPSSSDTRRESKGYGFVNESYPRERIENGGDHKDNQA